MVSRLSSNIKEKKGCKFDKLKDKDKTGLGSHVVYEIPCKDCKSVHIGQTKQYLKGRIYQHKTNIKKHST